MKRWLVLRCIGLLTGLAILTASQFALAQSHSTNYSVNEVFFGSGGLLNATSTNYSSKESLGETAIGNATGTAYQAFAGFNTTDQPFLQFVVSAATLNLNYLSTSTATTATGTFEVRAWLSGGYTVTTDSPPPISDAHTFTNLTTQTTSSPGTEQFGINLVQQNGSCGTGCNGVGTNPVQSPNSSFSFGQVEPHYDTPDQFRYVNGDAIAYSNSSSSITIYTITYLFNISSSTPAGTYTFAHTLVATATY